MFRDRVDAGRKLAAAVVQMNLKEVVVLGIPRGGVVVAREVAQALSAPLDVIVARKIGAPGEPEFALGAVTEEGEVVMDSETVEYLGVGADYIESQVTVKRDEVKKRMRELRGDSPYPDLRGRVVLIVDDGMATGSTMEAAVMSVRRHSPGEVVIAVPVAPASVIASISEKGNRVLCLYAPESFLSIGEFYEVFDQVEDEHVKRILAASRSVRS